MWIFGRRAHQEREQNTDAMQSLTPYPLHQREQPILSDHDLFERYRRAHPPRPQIHPVTPIPRTPVTGEMLQLALPAPRREENREWADVETARKLKKPAWMDNLPIQRQPPATVVSEFDPLATLLPERFRSPEVPPMPDLEMPDPDPLGFAGLPTWIAPATIDKRIEDIISRSQPLANDAWLTAPAPTTLDPMDKNALAAADKTASSVIFDLQSEECKPDMDDLAPTEEGPRVRFEKIIKQIRESE